MLKIKTTFQALFVLYLVSFNLLQADEKQVLETLLTEFLAGQTEAHHARFWADELIYTSSNGTRFGKAEIMASFAEPAEDSKESEESVPETKYSASDIDIRVHKDHAIVAFKLIATQGDKVIQTYWNTGTFAIRDAGWQAIAWQATMIPQDSDS